MPWIPILLPDPADRNIIPAENDALPAVQQSSRPIYRRQNNTTEPTSTGERYHSPPRGVPPARAQL